MIRRVFNDESGYSLVEVIVSILLLSVAVTPMVGMFDAALRAATTGSNYDKGRTLANSSMENIKSLPYIKSSPSGVNDSVVENFVPGADRACPVIVPTGFSCAVRTRYANSTLSSFQTTPQTSQMEIVVKTGWGGDPARITATGLVSRSGP